MQNRTQEDGGNIFGADSRQYDFDDWEQGPAIHMVGGSEDSNLGLHIYKNRFSYCKKYCYDLYVYLYNASMLIYTIFLFKCKLNHIVILIKL